MYHPSQTQIFLNIPLSGLGRPRLEGSPHTQSHLVLCGWSRAEKNSVPIILARLPGDGFVSAR